jgi:hypothetical protein
VTPITAGHRHAHVFVPTHGGVEVEIIDVNGHPAGAWRGEDAVDQELGEEDAGSFCAGFAWIIDPIATNGESHTNFDCFVWLVGDDESQVSGLAPFGNLRRMNEMHCVSAVPNFYYSPFITKQLVV